MSATTGSRASELAARQVEQIVAAAQEAAEEIRKEARLEQHDIRRWAEQDSEEVRKEARRDAERMIEDARKRAILLGSDARREAEAMLAEAKQESRHMREQTQRAVEGRVAAADKAAAEVLEEARTLSGGLHQLGKSLEDHADRILRDVSAAHKRMQADLRIGESEPVTEPEPARRPERATPRSAPARQAVVNSRGDDGERRDTRVREAAGERRRGLEELELPSWIEPS